MPPAGRDEALVADPLPVPAHVLRRLAVKLLAGGVSKAGAVARLGYSDARALRRAIRRWTKQ